MTTTGGHPAMKIKKHIQLPADMNRRPSQSNPPSQTDSTSNTLNPDTSTGSGHNQGRRKSTFKQGVAGLVATNMNLRRMTRASIPNNQVQEPLPKVNVRYENTYKMEPEDGTRFLHNAIEQKVYALLEEQVKDLSYDASTAAHLSQTVADVVKNTVKSMFSPRYKLVTSVVVGQNQHQGMETASRCLWDESKDNFASVIYKNKSLFVTVLIFACYFE